MSAGGLADVPEEILEAARKLREWGEMRQLRNWAVLGVGPKEEPNARIERLEHLLRSVQTDRCNWLHSELQHAIEKEVGPAGAYRALEEAFANEPERSIVNDALGKRLSEPGEPKSS